MVVDGVFVVGREIVCVRLVKYGVGFFFLDLFLFGAWSDEGINFW